MNAKQFLCAAEIGTVLITGCTRHLEPVPAMIIPTFPEDEAKAVLVAEGLPTMCMNGIEPTYIPNDASFYCNGKTVIKIVQSYDSESGENVNIAQCPEGQEEDATATTLEGVCREQREP